MRQLHRLRVLASMAAAAVDCGTPASTARHRRPSQPTRQSRHAARRNQEGAADSGFKRTPAPANAYVYIGWPNDGETVRTTHIKVWFGTRNFGVAPAGTNKPNTGHHHLLIDTALPPLDQPIPNDKNHLHFGLGQTEAYDRSAARNPHPAASDGRCRPHPARSAGHVKEDHHPCPCGRNPCGRGALNHHYSRSARP